MINRRKASLCCKHGQLARQCEMCEMEQELARLRDELDGDGDFDLASSIALCVFLVIAMVFGLYEAVTW